MVKSVISNWKKIALVAGLVLTGYAGARLKDAAAKKLAENKAKKEENK